MHTYDLANMVLQKISDYRRLNAGLHMLSGFFLSGDTTLNFCFKVLVLFDIIIFASKVGNLINLI